MPAAADLSDENAGIQWPLPQPWPAGHPPLRLGVMASGHGSNFEALVASCRHGPLNASVEVLVVNKPGCGAIERAERLGVSWRLLDHRRFSSREALDGALIEAFPQRLVNIHPSLLPSFRGVDAIGQALAAGVTLAGCSAHLVTAEVDGGPILVQAAVPVCPGDDHARLAARIQQQEHRILPLAVALAAERLGFRDRRAATAGRCRRAAPPAG